MAAGHTIDAIWARHAVSRLEEARQPVADILIVLPRLSATTASL